MAVWNIISNDLVMKSLKEICNSLDRIEDCIIWNGEDNPIHSGEEKNWR